MRRFCLCLVLTLALLGLSADGGGAPQQRVVVAVDDWPPYRFVNDDPMHGLDFDLWKELATRMGLNVEFRKIPWLRSLVQMQQGKVDAMSGLARRPEREAYVYYIEPSYSFCSTRFYAALGKGVGIQTYEDLYGKRIGYVLGSAYFSPFDGDQKLTKIGVATEGPLLQMLLASHVDVMIGTDCQVDYAIAQNGMSDRMEKAGYAPKNRVNLYVGISRYSILFDKIGEFERVMRAMQADGTMRRIVHAYFPSREPGR